MRVRKPPVSHECIDGEVVVINMENGTYYSLLHLGARLWELVAAGSTRAELLERIATAYPDEPRAMDEVSAFVDELLSEGLVTEEEGARTVLEPVFPSPYASPRLEKFTDLQEMLMLDPIHEVDAAAGWPHKPN
jgi:coenzyme PQQ synthesis protein D (PqqD)